MSKIFVKICLTSRKNWWVGPMNMILHTIVPKLLQYSYRKSAMNECTYDFYELQWSNLYEKSWNNDTICQKPILLDATNHKSYSSWNYTCK